jgi:tetratricopeptide (TPR) repeat protein
VNKPTPVENIEEQIYFLIERGRLEQAVTLAGTTLKEYPHNNRIYLTLAAVHIVKNELDDAKAIVEEILVSDPEFHYAKHLLASINRDLKNYFEAERLVIELLADNPGGPGYYVLYSKIMLETLHLDKAKKLADEALRLDPEDLSAMTNSLIVEIIRGDKDAYTRTLSEMVTLYPEALSVSKMILHILIEQKKLKEAHRLATELFQANPKDKKLLFTIKELRALTHPSMLILKPAIKYGWHASAILWFLFIVLAYILATFVSVTIALVWVAACFLYIIFSLISPPILKRIIN